eukprot:536912_1
MNAPSSRLIKVPINQNFGYKNIYKTVKYVLFICIVYVCLTVMFMHMDVIVNKFNVINNHEYNATYIKQYIPPSDSNIKNISYHLSSKEKAKNIHVKLNSSKFNILIVFSTVPEMMKLAPIIWEFESAAADNIDIYCLLLGKHIDLINNKMMDNLNINKCFYIKMKLETISIYNSNNRLSDLTASILTSITSLLSLHRFNMLIVEGDTTTAMSSCLAAYYVRNISYNIIIAHIEAGLRTYYLDSPFPEEFNRELISKIATINYAPTYYAINNLLNDNIAPNSVINSHGNTVIDAIKWIYANKQFKKQFSDYLLSINNNILYNAINNYNEDNKLKYGLLTIHQLKYRNLLSIIAGITEILNIFPNLHIFYPVYNIINKTD